MMRHVKGQGDNGPGRPALKEIVEAAADAPPNRAVQKSSVWRIAGRRVLPDVAATRGELGPGKSPRE